MSLTTYTIELDGNEIDLTIEYDAECQRATYDDPEYSSLDMTDVMFDLPPDATCTEEQVIAFITQPVMEQKLEEACWEHFMTQSVDDRY